MTPRKPRPTCFVVQPMGNRSGLVNLLYLNPALAKEFDLIIPGAEPSSSIKAEVFSNLENSSVVLAFLGAPYQLPSEGDRWLWNANVMLEAGYRMGLGKPLVFLREKRVRDSEPLLPFDIFDESVIELPNADEEAQPIFLEKAQSRIYNYVRSALDKAKPETNLPHHFYTHPSIALAFGGGSGTVTSASDDAADFYRYPSGTNIVGHPILEIVNKLKSEMAPSQRMEFSQEQEQLLGQIMMGKKPSATVCIVFGKEPIAPGGIVDNAYLPIITRFNNHGEPTVLEVFYLDVTATAVVGADGIVRCNLGLAKAAAGK